MDFCIEFKEKQQQNETEKQRFYSIDSRFFVD